uniref:Uncharacterized protein n=1 Tax=Anguilla anguilla TaxID=7936 RepID=A0A0E9X9J5_ANGAN
MLVTINNLSRPEEDGFPP